MKPIIIWSYLVLGASLVVMGIIEKPLQPAGELLLGTAALLIVTITFALSRHRKAGERSLQK
jgi:hypothetical protein